MFDSLQPPRRAAAFTLIELLVVISIIALLVGILLLVLSSSRKAAQLVVCASNARQLQLAANVYIEEDERHRFPMSSMPQSPLHLPPVRNPDESWTRSLASYGITGEVLRCPGDESRYWQVSAPGMRGLLRRSSYGSNRFLSDWEIFDDGVSLFNGDIHTVKNPSGLIGFGETKTGLYGTSDEINQATWSLAQYRGEVALDNHARGLVNWSYLDGHVATPSRDEIAVSLEHNSMGLNGKWSHNQMHPDLAR